jgi:hypothetical protein
VVTHVLDAGSDDDVVRAERDPGRCRRTAVIAPAHIRSMA